MVRAEARAILRFGDQQGVDRGTLGPFIGSNPSPYYAPGAELRFEELLALQAGRLVAFEVRIEPVEE